LAQQELLRCLNPGMPRKNDGRFTNFQRSREPKSHILECSYDGLEFEKLEKIDIN